MVNSLSLLPGTLSIVLNPPPTSDAAYVAGLPLSGFVYARSEAMAPKDLRADVCVSVRECSHVWYTKVRHYLDSWGNRRTGCVTWYHRLQMMDRVHTDQPRTCGSWRPGKGIVLVSVPGEADNRSSQEPARARASRWRQRPR